MESQDPETAFITNAAYLLLSSWRWTKSCSILYIDQLFNHCNSNRQMTCPLPPKNASMNLVVYTPHSCGESCDMCHPVTWLTTGTARPGWSTDLAVWWRQDLPVLAGKWTVNCREFLLKMSCVLWKLHKITVYRNKDALWIVWKADQLTIHRFLESGCWPKSQELSIPEQPRRLGIWRGSEWSAWLHGRTAKARRDQHRSL